MRDLYMNIRMGFKFFFWLVRRMLGLGKTGWVTSLWGWTRDGFETPGPELAFIMLLFPLLGMLLMMVLVLPWYGPSDPQGIVVAFWIDGIFWTVFNGSAFLSVMWERFTDEYEQSFTILREFKGK
jgi:hypothetical protein